MNDSYNHCWRNTCLIGIILCFLVTIPSHAQEAKASATPTQTKIILRSIGAKGELQKNPSTYRLNIWNNPIVNALYSASDTIIKVVEKNSQALEQSSEKAIQTWTKTPIPAKSISQKIPGVAHSTLKDLSIMNKVGTGGSFMGAVAGNDPVGAGESLLNSAGSGTAATLGAKGGAAIGSFVAPGLGTIIGGCIGSCAGVLVYNEVAAPQVTKVGDSISDRISDHDAKITQIKLAIKRQQKKDFDLVYPHGYIGDRAIDPWTGFIEDLRPDRIADKATKIRERQKAFNQKLEDEISKLTKKGEWPFADDQALPASKGGKTPAISPTGNFPIPDVRKHSLTSAYSILKRAGFNIGQVVGGDPAPSKKWVKHVQEQLPRNGTIQSTNQPVLLVLYSDVLIPSVVGMTAEQALKTLKSAGFTMLPEGADPPPTPNLSLLAKKQDPQASSLGKDHSSVRVSFYPPFQLTVPGITNLTSEQARGILKKKGLLLSTDHSWGDRATSKDQVGKIQKQQPAEGETLTLGGEVKVSLYYTDVPNVIPMNKTQALTVMKSAWFNAHAEKGEVSKNKNNWETIHFQSLQPGKKYTEPDIPVTLQYYYNPKMLKHALAGRWTGTSQKKNSKVKVKFFWDIHSVDKNGKILGTITIPKQEVPLHNGKGTTFSISKSITRPFHGALNGNQFTIYYNVLKTGKGKMLCVWDPDANTIQTIQFTSHPSLHGGKWHNDNVIGTLKKGARN